MRKIPIILAFIAAALFIAISATMNGLFLSSLGRTKLEAGLFAGVSLAADLSKAILPLALATAISRRHLGQALVSAALLVAVVALSLASGIGFAATTRKAVATAHTIEGERQKQLAAEMADLDRRHAALTSLRPVAAIEADLKVALMQRGWITSRSCTLISTQAERRTCEAIARLEGERGLAAEQANIGAARSQLQQAMLQSRETTPDPDAQVTALAETLRLSQAQLRAWITLAIAMVIELGSVGLILIAAGPALRDPPVPRSPDLSPPAPATVPVLPDRRHWQRQHERRKAAPSGTDAHGP